jgi:hypothetical protein
VSSLPHSRTAWNACVLTESCRLLWRIRHRLNVTCTAEESWTSYLILSRQGIVNLNAASSRQYNPHAVLNIYKSVLMSVSSRTLLQTHNMLQGSKQLRPTPFHHTAHCATRRCPHYRNRHYRIPLFLPNEPSCQGIRSPRWCLSKGHNIPPPPTRRGGSRAPIRFI